MSEYFVTTKEKVRYTLDEYLRDELNSGYILKSITDLPQIRSTTKTAMDINQNRHIRVITEFSDKARTHKAYGRAIVHTR